MSEKSTRGARPAERNWADLMDDLLNENFAAQARGKLRMGARTAPSADSSLRGEEQRTREHPVSG